MYYVPTSLDAESDMKNGIPNIKGSRLRTYREHVLDFRNLLCVIDQEALFEIHNFTVPVSKDRPVRHSLIKGSRWIDTHRYKLLEIPVARGLRTTNLKFIAVHSQYLDMWLPTENRRNGDYWYWLATNKRLKGTERLSRLTLLNELGVQFEHAVPMEGFQLPMGKVKC